MEIFVDTSLTIDYDILLLLRLLLISLRIVNTSFMSSYTDGSSDTYKVVL